MSIVQCPNGHFYNNETFKQCPICSGVGSTIPDVAIAAAGTVLPGGQSLNEDDGPTVLLQADDEAKTVAMYDSQEYSIEPVTGWLVCCEGAERGRDFRLGGGINSIGKGGNNRISLKEDTIPEGEVAAMLAFAERKRSFLISIPVDSQIEVQINGEPLSSQTLLQPRDELRIGNTLLRFIPFCDDNFIW